MGGASGNPVAHFSYRGVYLPFMEMVAKMKEIEHFESELIKVGRAFVKALQDCGMFAAEIKQQDVIAAHKSAPIEPWRQKGKKPWRQRR